MLESIHGLKLSLTEVIITVTSTGCTTADDFRIDVQDSQPPSVTFIREQADPCKVIPHTVDLPFSLKRIGSAEFTVANPFSPGPIRRP